MREHYTTYTSVQLAGEESFIDWVMHGTHAGDWERWLQKNPQLHPVTKEAQQIVRDIGATFPTAEISARDQENLWNRIATDIKTTPVKKTTRSFNLARWASVAAAIILLVYFITRNPSTAVVAEAGERITVDLPDRSTVVLNAGSTIQYSKKSFLKDRELNLTGEAFFQVRQGSQFAVHTDGGVVTVLGTKFNVLSREDRFEVSCLEGKVSVENQHDNTILEKGKRCEVNTATKNLDLGVLATTLDAPEWTRGKFVFEDETLKTVVEELERQYNIKVILAPGLEELRYTGLFESGDLEKALSLVTWPLHLKANVNGTTVSIAR